MKINPINLLVLVTLTLVLQASPAQCLTAQEIIWQSDLGNASQQAAQENKLVLLHFTATWCRPCKALETFVFTAPKVRRAMQDNVVPVKIDVDQFPALVKQYGVAGVPFDVAMTSTGRVVSRRSSPRDSNAYAAMIESFDNVLNALENEHPGLNQELTQLTDKLYADQVETLGDNSFTPAAPTHQAPVPSHVATGLKRKNHVVNPFAVAAAEEKTVSPKLQTNNFFVPQSPQITPPPTSTEKNVTLELPSFQPAVKSENDFNPGDSNSAAISNSFVASNSSAPAITPPAVSVPPVSVPPPSVQAAITPKKQSPPASLIWDAPLVPAIESPFPVAHNNWQQVAVQSPPPVAEPSFAVDSPSQPADPTNQFLQPGPSHSIAQPEPLLPTSKPTSKPAPKPASKLTPDTTPPPTPNVAQPVKPTGRINQILANSESSKKLDALLQPQPTAAPSNIIKPQSTPNVQEEFHSPSQSKPKPKVVFNQQLFENSPAKQTSVSNSRDSNEVTNSSVANEGQRKDQHSEVQHSEVRHSEKHQAVDLGDRSKFALFGKCPVTLLHDGEWVDGDPQWGCSHRNKTYLFANQERMEAFQKDPDAFSPLLAGYDPVVFERFGKLVDGKVEHGVFMGKSPNQRVVLFSTADTRAEFQKQPKLYIQSIRQAMQTTGGSSSNIMR